MWFLHFCVNFPTTPRQRHCIYFILLVGNAVLLSIYSCGGAVYPYSFTASAL